ncbi:hypothetical protein OS493_010708 [Desmophyllum pertusum]|uniref:Uncharacterized protein n=1 Tax=Desmophyllum pertusum TaxID=174260 RepID=A0A9W9ZQZ9_9CNID|nr:hypothetical protein OS493_010708 [Desmophyllum pertusum]
MAKLMFLLLGTVATGNMQFSSPSCDQLSSSKLNFVAEWRKLKPYITSASSSSDNDPNRGAPTEGLLYELLHRMINPGRISYKLVKASSRPSNTTENTTISIPVMIKGHMDGPCDIRVHHSKGPAYIAKRNQMKPLTQFFHSYGDTSPKSVPARLYSILWMLLGMVAFSVLTANFTSSLNYEIEADLNLFGKTVAVLNGSLAGRAAVSEGAKYIAFNDIEVMIKALAEVKNSPVNGLLLDRHVAVASLELFKKNSLEIARTLDYDYFIGMSIRPPQNSTLICDMVKKCVDDLVHSEAFELTALKGLSDSVSVVQNEKQSTSLFNDYEFLIILLALFGVLLSGGLLWEYFYYRPKMERLNKVNAEDFEMTGGERNKDSDKAILLANEVEDLCDECRAKVENIMKEEGKQRLQSLQSVISPFDGFSISAIPGVSSIRKIGSELPLTRKSKKNKQEVETL